MLRATASARTAALFVALAALLVGLTVSAPAANAATVGQSCSAWTKTYTTGINTRSCVIVSYATPTSKVYRNLVEVQNTGKYTRTVNLRMVLEHAGSTTIKYPSVTATAGRTVSTSFSVTRGNAGGARVTNLARYKYGVVVFESSSTAYRA